MYCSMHSRSYQHSRATRVRPAAPAVICRRHQYTSQDIMCITRHCQITCQVADNPLIVGFRWNKYAHHLDWTEMYPHRRNFARIHPETQTGAEILSCEACTGREAASTRQNMFATRCSSRKCSFHHNLSGHATQMSSIEGYKHSGRLLAGSHYPTSSYRLYSRADVVR